MQQQSLIVVAVETLIKLYCSVKYDIVMPNGAIRIKRSIQRKELYLRMSNVLLSNSILAIYEL
jgi:hypothetical protein